MNRKVKDNLFATLMTALVIAFIVLANVVLYSLTAINEWYFVYTEEIDLSLSGSTRELFADAEKKGRKVDIIFCMPKDELANHTTGKDVLRTVEQLKELHPDFINIKYYNVTTKLDENGKSVSAELEKYKTDMRGKETVIHKGTVIFSSKISDGAGNVREDYIVLGNQYSGVPFVDFFHIDTDGYITAYIGEEVVASMVLWTLATEHKTVYFTKGHGESVDVAFAKALERAGYYVEELDLLRTKLVNNESADKDNGLNVDRAAMVIISNPTADFLKGDGVDAEIEKLREYLGTYGGSLYVSLDPYAKTLPNLEALLSEYGISMMSGKADDGEIYRQIVRESQNATPGDGGFTFVANYADNEFGKKFSEKTGKYVDDKVLLKNAGALSLSGSATPVLVTSASADTLVKGETVETSEQFAVAAISEKTENNVTSKVFVTSSVYLTASDAVVSDSYANRGFTYALFETFFDAPVAPYGCKAVPYSTGRLDVTMGTARLYTVLVMIIPVAIAAVGIVVNKRRKNR